MKGNLLKVLIISFFLVSFASCGVADKDKKNYILCRKRIIECANTIDPNSTSYSEKLRQKILEICNVYGFLSIQDFEMAKDKYETIFKDDPKRVVECEQLSAILEQLASDSFGFEFRAVSLRILLQRLMPCHRVEDIPKDISHFCGLTRIMGYVVDEPNCDIILLGEVEPNKPPLYLEDFVIALRNTWCKYAKKEKDTIKYSYPGCSIDPDPIVIQRLNDIGKHISGNSQSGEARDAIEKWKKICESPQKVSVLGVPFLSRFGWVMVKADYDAKCIVDGSDSLELPGFISLLDIEFEQAKNRLLNGKSKSGSQSLLNRFEFCAGKNAYLEDEDMVLIDKCEVILMTEEEYLSKGKIVGKGSANLNAMRFAQRFSALYPEISVKRSIYRELENLFRFVALAKILNFKSPHEKVGLDIEYLLEGFPEYNTRVCESLPGRSNIREFSHQKDFEGGHEIYYLQFPSCGGVSIAIDVDQGNFSKVQEDYLKKTRHAAIEARPSKDSLSWNRSVRIINRQDISDLIRKNRINIEDCETFIVSDLLSRYTLCNDKSRIIFNGNNKVELLRILKENSRGKKGVILIMKDFRSEDDVVLFSYSLQLLNDIKDLIFIPVVFSKSSSSFLEMLISPLDRINIISEAEPETKKISEGQFKDWFISAIKFLLGRSEEENKAELKFLSENPDQPKQFSQIISNLISLIDPPKVPTRYIYKALKILLRGTKRVTPEEKKEIIINYIKQLDKDIRIP